MGYKANGFVVKWGLSRKLAVSPFDALLHLMMQEEGIHREQGDAGPVFLDFSTSRTLR